MTTGATRSCPFCGANEHVEVRAKQRERIHYSIVRCVRCDFVFVAQLHSPTFRSEQQAPAQPPVRARYRHIKRVCDHLLLTRDHGAQRKVVEVGAGWGGLAQTFSSDPRYRYTGFEPSAARASYCAGRGLDVREELFAGRESAGEMDAVVIDNVLEHVAEPAPLVEQAVATLSPGGVLVISVPNVHDVRQLHHGWRERHHWQPDCHINYFSASHLRALMQRYGLSCRYFGFEIVEGLRDLPVVARIVADKLGLHVLGLNCFGVKPAAAARGSDTR